MFTQRLSRRYGHRLAVQLKPNLRIRACVPFPDLARFVTVNGPSVSVKDDPKIQADSKMKSNIPNESTSHAVRPESSLSSLQFVTAGNNLEPMRTHQFDTYKLVSALEKAGYTHSQAIALMKCLRAVLVNGTEFAKSHYLSRGDLENVSLLCELK